MISRSRLSPRFLKTSLALLCSALVTHCSAPRPTLNSDLILQKFGSYGVQVLSQSGSVRVSNLFSGQASDSVTRTFAVVKFDEQLPQALQAPHQKILAGGSLGATLSDHGWKLAKRTLQHSATMATPRLARMMNIAVGTPLATHVYALSVKADNVNVHYALIAEIHHPAHLTDVESKQRFPTETENDRRNGNHSHPSLEELHKHVKSELRKP